MQTAFKILVCRFELSILEEQPFYMVGWQKQYCVQTHFDFEGTAIAVSDFCLWTLNGLKPK